MTSEERERIENAIFEKPKIKKESEIAETENVLKVAPTIAPFIFCWWSEYLGCEIEVFENKGKEFYTSVQEFDNLGFVKQCNIPKNVCEIIY